jgi:hypothetical protein
MNEQCGKRIIRVFPRRVKKATPDDVLAIVNRRPELFDEADEVHVSVTFERDLPRAEELAKDWRAVAPVRIGGPATGERGGDFEPGMYVKRGYVITSRGCPNRCWFCSVWKREGDAVRELPIRDGWNVLDDNLLACSDSHIRAVFDMLAKQPRNNPPQFTGGMEAKRLKPWHAAAMRKLRPKQVFFAYDTPDDLEPLREAGRIMLGAGFTVASHALRCYVLCGWKSDTEAAADKRMIQAMDAGFTPMAMAYQDKRGKMGGGWAAFQRKWARVAIIHANAGGSGLEQD